LRSTSRSPPTPHRILPFTPDTTTFCISCPTLFTLPFRLHTTPCVPTFDYLLRSPPQFYATITTSLPTTFCHPLRRLTTFKPTTFPALCALPGSVARTRLRARFYLASSRWLHHLPCLHSFTALPFTVRSSPATFLSLDSHLVPGYVLVCWVRFFFFCTSWSLIVLPPIRSTLVPLLHSATVVVPVRCCCYDLRCLITAFSTPYVCCVCCCCCTTFVVRSLRSASGLPATPRSYACRNTFVIR